MTTIYCSSKLSDLLGIKRHEPRATNQSIFDNWNATLFYLKGKKCLIFVNKPTLYTLMLIDFKVAEFKKLHDLLYSTLVFQLKADELYTAERAELFRTNFTGILFSTTDNDRKIIGSMNEFILQFTAAFEAGNITGKAYSNGIVATYINEMIMGALNFKKPIEKLNELLVKNAV